MRRAVAFLALALLPLMASAQAAVTAAEAREARTVIEAQLDAFRRDDAPRAFSYAASGIREMFGTPEKFMAMVRASYAVVYRPRTVAFIDPPERVGDELVVPVRLTDEGGRAWIALYPMQREPDGAWRINGCRLGRLGGQET